MRTDHPPPRQAGEAEERGGGLEGRVGKREVAHGSGGCESHRSLNVERPLRVHVQPEFHEIGAHLDTEGLLSLYLYIMFM
jgi:hypothetical protein